MSVSNSVILAGTIAAPPVLSHELFGERFLETIISVKRLSGAEDRLPLTLPERLLAEGEPLEGTRVCVRGQLRSANRQLEGRGRLILSVFAQDIHPAGASPDRNEIYLDGFLCKPAIYRTTPFGREIADMLLAVNRAYHKSDYIPCVAWGRNARFAGKLAVGDEVGMEGRIQSRVYEKTLESGETENRTAYEASVSRLVMKHRAADRV